MYVVFDTEEDMQEIMIARSVVCDFFDNPEIGSKIASALTLQPGANQSEKISWFYPACYLYQVFQPSKFFLIEEKNEIDYCIFCYLSGPS